MKRFWRQHDETSDIEARLRASRSEPRTEFVRTLGEQIGTDGRRLRLYTFSRVSFAGALTVLMLGTLASFGGLGYAATGTKQAVKAVKMAVVSSKPNRIVRESAAQDQYGPKKVTICHRPPGNPDNAHTITVSQSAVPAHLAHGDTLGPCPARTSVRGASASGKGGKGPAGGVAPARTSGAAGVKAVAARGTLPFTGLSLGGTALASLLLIGLGVGLRRRADRLS